jgi:Fe-S-cluster-containing dehydrogenase component
MGKVFLFDYAYCNGCYACQIACKDEHCNQSWLPYAAEQPTIGQFWMRINEIERGQIPVVSVSYETVFCNHCQDAPCIAAGGGAVYRRDDGLVIVDPEKAKGNRQIVDSCPLGAIYWNEELELAQKCTGCAHLLDNGWEVPRCVDACPTEALKYVDENSIDLSNAEMFEALDGLGPQVYLINKPKRFVAGCIVDAVVEEVVIGAEVSLLDTSGLAVASLQTDEFGDFKFDQIEKAVYTIECQGKQVPADVTERDLCVGDVYVVE